MALENMSAAFTGLPMGDLIGGPLNAACDAQVRLAMATVNFITTVGFEQSTTDSKNPFGKTRTAQFKFKRPNQVSPATQPTYEPLSPQEQTARDNALKKLATAKAALAAADNAKEDRTTQAYKDKEKNVSDAQAEVDKNPPRKVKTPGAPAVIAMEDVEIEVPVLAIVKVPALSINAVDITFDMEVKSSESSTSKDTKEGSLEASASVGWGPFSASVSIKGSVSSTQENTRKSDNSAKYHVEVHARDEGMPEGLSRVLDILQQAVAPKAISAPTPVTA